MMNLPPKQGLAFRRKHPLNEDLAGIRIKFLENKWPSKRVFREKNTPFYAFSWPRTCTPKGRRSVSNIGGTFIIFQHCTGGRSCPLFGFRGEAPGRQAIWCTSEPKNQRRKDSVCSKFFEYSNHISHKMPLPTMQ